MLITLRNADFTIPRFNTVTHGKYSLSFLEPKLWASLSDDLRKSETLKIFKSWIRTLNLTELISENCYY